jgi:hypothetical protein
VNCWCSGASSMDLPSFQAPNCPPH